MSEHDIYKSRERLSPAKAPKKRRRRRSQSGRKFDEHDRSKSRRRSSNSGFRRMRHVLKKPDIQKIAGWIIALFLILLIGFVAVWQFWYQDHLAYKEQDRKAEERAAREASE